jgi:hypothetical protein
MEELTWDGIEAVYFNVLDREGNLIDWFMSRSEAERFIMESGYDNYYIEVDIVT